MSPNAAISEAVKRIVEGFNPQRVILFGSRARGDARERSDIDLLVLVDDGVDVWSVTTAIYGKTRGINTPIDVVVMNIGYFEDYKDLIGTVARPASREGRVLYQRAA
ncbi:MAG TPA: nucleotidyltransferase domain-containing protein [Phycisphaerales bacterium]|nr:nucleotidyltransferase domain-containing protein [Phycisphaerales bacterium]